MFSYPFLLSQENIIIHPKRKVSQKKLISEKLFGESFGILCLSDRKTAGSPKAVRCALFHVQFVTEAPGHPSKASDPLRCNLRLNAGLCLSKRRSALRFLQITSTNHLCVYSLFISCLHNSPVNHIEKALHIVCSEISVLQIISMLPYINSKYRDAGSEA